MVIEHNPALAREMERRGMRYIYGDVAERSVLVEAGIGRTNSLAFTICDTVAKKDILRLVEELNPNVRVVVRVHYLQEMDSLRGDRAVSFVHPEFEASMDFVQQALLVYGLDEAQAAEHVRARREQYYGNHH